MLAKLSTARMVAVVVCLWSAGGLADEEITSTRALGMADALRGAATGAAGLHLNPSGIMLVRSYIVEGAFEFRDADSAKYVDVAVVDSITSRVGGGLYFDYLAADIKDSSRTKVGELSGWEVGAVAAYPLADYASLGITPKYQSIDQPQALGGKADGFTIDAGLTLRPVNVLNIGVVGTNLVEQDSTRAPRSFALGVAVNPFGALLLAFDTVFDFDTSRLLEMSDKTGERYHFGGEYLFAEKFAVRGGYIYDDVLHESRSHVAYGASLVTPQLAIDFGGRTQTSGPAAPGPGEHATLFGVSLRLFLQ